MYLATPADILAILRPPLAEQECLHYSHAVIPRHVTCQIFVLNHYTVHGVRVYTHTHTHTHIHIYIYKYSKGKDLP
jgi:hypothetical protein